MHVVELDMMGVPPKSDAGAGEGEGEDEDRLSELPDELLVEILQRTDSFTAASTSALSRRWRRRDLCRWLTAFDFPVTRFVPPEYDYDELSALYRCAAAAEAVEAIAERLVLCEKRATEAYVHAVARLLRLPRRYPSIKRLLLEFFLSATGSPETGARVTSCVRSAMCWFHVEHLAVDVLPGAASVVAAAGPRPYAFPLDLLSRRRLSSLHLTNCVVRASAASNPSGCRLFHGPIELTVRHTRGAFCSNSNVARMLATCRRLQSLRLVSCVFVHKSPFRIDAPPESSLRALVVDGCGAIGDMVVDNAPGLEELVVDRCQLNALKIANAPRLRRLVCRNTVEAPELGAKAATAEGLLHVDVGFLDPGEGEQHDTLRRFLGGVSPRVEELTLYVSTAQARCGSNPSISQIGSAGSAH